LVKRWPGLKYDVIGPGDQARLRRICGELDLDSNVDFLGPLPFQELITRAAAADAFVMPSREIPGRPDLIEGFGLAYLEAAALGLPSVAGRSGGVPDAVLDGETGFVVEPTSVEAVGNAIARLLADPASGSSSAAKGCVRIHLAADCPEDAGVDSPTPGGANGGSGAMRTVITGGAGFIGSALAARLLATGGEVVVYDNFASGERGYEGARRSEALGAEVIAGDILNADALAGALRGASHVVHLAAVASVPASFENPQLTHQVNLEGTRVVLAEARTAGVERVVFHSTAAVYGSEPCLPSREEDPKAPASPYAESKLRSESDCSRACVEGLPTVVLRPFNVYGPGQDPRSSYSGVLTRWTTAMREGRPIELYGDGTQTRDFLYVGDLVGAIIAALERPDLPPGAVNIGSGVSTSLLDLLTTLSDVLSVTPQIRYLPAREGDVLHSRADISRARDWLGYAPAMSLREGLGCLLNGAGCACPAVRS
jgi:UDP-glucose 4-epimerase